VVLNLLSTTPPPSNCPLFQAPDFKEVVKTNVFIGKFTDQTFHVLGIIKICASLEIH